MRLTLDRTRNLVLALPSDNEQPDPLHLQLGQAANRLHLLPDAAGDYLPAGAELGFIVKSSGSTAQILVGSYTILTADVPDVDTDEGADLLQIIELDDEDWSAAALVLLFGSGDTETVDLLGQWRWRLSSSDDWNPSPWMNIRVQGTLFPVSGLPGAVTLGGSYYISSITDYTGGTDADLDHLDERGIPLNTVVRIITDNGESAWRLEAGTDATSVDDGNIRARWFSITGKIWRRKSGV